ncbi:hypothetical protein CFIMG_001004RA [Ceratocystis fimbriata CBS 114723]|uniref:Uncharacterized protein n=1 Tax=Ceratocystis fimbriata CBS 114723 TaxID=1035309 RepID=A0A2C5X784_9PEZI|nr:hypothetical protein CFIMG_001004RA [Ceratocystis fimbriata CBS 114723]
MPLFSAQLFPHRALGFLTLGASLHDTITRLKAEPQCFPKLDLVYSRENPVLKPVTVNLSANGIRLRFDGSEQRLRLIEVLDFTKNHITYNNVDLAKPPATQNGSSSPAAGEPFGGPSFRHIYNKFLGPTYAGEFIPGQENDENGTYVLSYPGVAFTFPLPQSAYSPNKDVVSLLSFAPSQTAQSMAIFNGTSWAASRETIWTEILPSIKASTHLPRSKEVVPDEVSLVRIHGGGKLQLFKKWTNISSWISLGETSPQDLIAELGPPNAIYRKNDQRMTIHKQRTASHSRTREESEDDGHPGRKLDVNSAPLITDSDDTYNESSANDAAAGTIPGECFYNYFHLGFDVLVSSPETPSPPPPLTDKTLPVVDKPHKSTAPDRLVATKIVLHGNIPGSYEFNRHRRCRWEIAYLDPAPDGYPNSETPFTTTKAQLMKRWTAALEPGEVPKWENGMVLNRGWGDSPGSSCEFLGGWEENATVPGPLSGRDDGTSDSTTTLYGLPGLVFEVLRNDYVNAVTVF